MTDESGKEAMVRRGQWRITAPHVQGHAGFRLNSLVSLLANCAWPKLAAEWELVQDNEVRRKVFINTTLGQAWNDEDAGYTDVDLISRVEDFSLENIPAGSAGARRRRRSGRGSHRAFDLRRHA